MSNIHNKSDVSDGVDFGKNQKYTGKRRIGINTMFAAPAVIVPVLFSIVLIVFGAVFAKVWIAERETAQREVTAVERIFDSHRQSLIDEMERYAASNAAYINTVSTPDNLWIENRFGVDMVGDFSPDYSAVIDQNEKLIFASDHAGTSGKPVAETVLKGSFEGSIQTIRKAYLNGLVTDEAGQVSFTGQFADLTAMDILSVNEALSLVAAFAIVPDPGGIPMVSQAPHILISVFELNKQHLEGLLSILPVERLELVRDVPDNMIGIPLKNSAGTTLGHLAWHPISQATAIIVSSIPVLFLSLGAILVLVLAALRRITKAKQDLAVQEQEARKAACHDSMTGFSSRAHFYKQAGQHITSDSARKNGASLIYLDLDNLKEVNDIHGHMAGDWLIMSQALRIRKALGPDALVGRVGGDEFVILVEGRVSNQHFPEHLRQLFETLIEPVEFEGRLIDASCSAGVARFPDHGREILDVIRSADVALQRCKSEGKRSYRFFDDKMDQARRERRQMRCELVAALEENQFELFYQSIVASQTGRATHAEALLRWRHPERGLVSPAEFLPVAQEAGLMPEIGSWVLERAILDASSWENAGVSVNVSSSQLQKEGFAEQVADLLMQYGLPADRLLLEITEDLMLEEDRRTQKIFSDLQELNVGLAIDDFGTGYSSLSYLHKYRFNTMKIDRSFVARIGISSEDDMLVHTLLSIAKVMGMQTIGEGVETGEQRDFLVSAGCEYLQGYLFDRPAPLSMIDLKRAG
ncbi:putative bifunctional diguanylate cyclase/phosphodiesterase [Roseibium sp.]|uniref:putative bifunctional diguanylate cyclase/phosphodiesterase n=1 Tax=Roseibium sp. TaxID=1936156 RepID=UPI003B52E6D1